MIAACKYEGIEPVLTEAFIVDALANLYVQGSTYVGHVGTGDDQA